MNCSVIPSEIREYMEIVEKGPACSEQVALIEHVKACFESEHLMFDAQLFKNYLKLLKYFKFKELFPWQRFIFALWNCTFKKDGQPRWKTVLCMVGRGAGKDGFIAFDAFCMVSPFNEIKHYNVDICANNEDQAMQPTRDILEVLETPAHERRLSKHFYHTKELIKGRANKGVIRGRTNNPKGRDGMRSGKVIFNEVHQFENYDNIKVFITGQGKVAHPRVGIFTSNGEISDGPLDDYLARGRRILFEGEDDVGFFPFICCLNEKEQVFEPENWPMANPSLPYFPHLLQEITEEFEDWKVRPEQNGDFLSKRMGLRVQAKAMAVTDYEKIRATNRPIPDLSGEDCVIGLDYAELSDWAAVNIHFKNGNDRVDINHAWLCLNSKTLPRVKAPWRQWAADGHLTVVDDVSINPRLLTDYIQDAAQTYNVRGIALDMYRWTLLSETLRGIGFDAADKMRVKMVRPSDIMQIEPVIQECFDRGFFSWGDNPCLRWAVNNTKRIPRGKKYGADTGNFYYAKIEWQGRKTDMFMALVASMTIESWLDGGGAAALPDVGAIAF